MLDYRIKGSKIIPEDETQLHAMLDDPDRFEDYPKDWDRYVSGYVVSAGLGFRIKCWIIGLRALKLIVNMNFSYMLCWIIQIDLKIILKIEIDMYQDMW